MFFWKSDASDRNGWLRQGDSLIPLPPFLEALEAGIGPSLPGFVWHHISLNLLPAHHCLTRAGHLELVAAGNRELMGNTG